MQQQRIVQRSAWLAAGFIVLMLGGIFGAVRASGQATTATLVGTVTDTTGAVLGHATVMITNESTGQTYTGQTNDAGMLAWNREADYFLQMIKDQFDTLYREGAESGRVMCLALHPHNIGRPNAAKYLDEALRYILGHDGVWNTTADDMQSITSQTTIMM